MRHCSLVVHRITRYTRPTRVSKVGIFKISNSIDQVRGPNRWTISKLFRILVCTMPEKMRGRDTRFFFLPIFDSGPLNFSFNFLLHRLLDDKYTILYDSYKKAYAENLHRWRLLDARAQVLKHVSAIHHDTHNDVEFQSECHSCGKSSKGPQCASCKRLTFKCVICHISVRGELTIFIVDFNPSKHGVSYNENKF